MNARLSKIHDWSDLARLANWRVGALARLCKVSDDTLRRHFLANMGKVPQLWLADERQRQAAELLNDGSSVKEVAVLLGYRQQTNFTRKFKEYWGTCPSTTLFAEK